MANAYLLSPRLSDAAVMTASDSVAGCAIGNIQVPRPSLYWRSTSNSPYIVGDLGATHELTSLVLGFINGRTGSDTFRLRTATTEANLTGSPNYDSGAQPIIGAGATDDIGFFNLIHRAWPFVIPDLVARWFRVDFDFSTNTDGYVQMSRLLLGARVEPTRSIAMGSQAGFNEPVAETIDLGGEESSRPMGAKRDINILWGSLTQTERNLLYSLLLWVGSARDVALVIDPGLLQADLYVGRIKQALSFTKTLRFGTADDDNLYSLALRVSEMAPVSMV